MGLASWTFFAVSSGGRHKFLAKAKDYVLFTCTCTPDPFSLEGKGVWSGDETTWGEPERAPLSVVVESSYYRTTRTGGTSFTRSHERM